MTCSQASEPSFPPRPALLLDTDMGADCDDAGALAMLHHLADAGETDILGVVHSSAGRMPWGVGVCAAINAHHGRPDLPLAAYRGTDVGEPADKLFAEDIARDTARHGHTITRAEEAEDALALYLRVLARAPAASVSIVTIGHLRVLRALLETAPELVAAKVRELVVMGGKFPASGSSPEWNFSAHGAAPHTLAVLSRWPGPVCYTGYEIGDAIYTGQGYSPDDLDDPVARAYAGFHRWHRLPLARGRQSWDQTAVLYAVRGLAGLWRQGPSGRILLEPDGTNSWASSPEGSQRYLVAAAPVEDAARAIQALMTPPQPAAKG